MGTPDFWNNQEKAQQTINALKPLNGLLKPYEEIEVANLDIGALAELCAEEVSLEVDLAAELDKADNNLAEFELRSMLNGPQDASNAYLRIQAGGGGTEACDWAQMLLRMYSQMTPQRYPFLF